MAKAASSRPASPAEPGADTGRLRFTGVQACRGGRRVLGAALLVLVVSSCASAGTGDAPGLVVAEWGNVAVSTLCVAGEEDYGSGLNAATPVQEGIASFFTDIVVEGGCDAVITVRLTGKALSAVYRIPEAPAGLRLYTGAEVQGTMSLAAEGEPPLAASIGGYLPTPGSVVRGGSNPRAPLGAPFWGAAYDDVCRVMKQWFGADEERLRYCP